MGARQRKPPTALFQKRHERYLASHKQAFTTAASRLTIEINFNKSFGVIRNRSLDVAAVGGLVHEGSRHPRAALTVCSPWAVGTAHLYASDSL